MTDPYFVAKSGDTIQSQHWNQVQIRLRDEVKTHTHSGGEQGTRLTGDAIDAGSTLTIKHLAASAGLTVGNPPQFVINAAGAVGVGTAELGTDRLRVVGSLRADLLRVTRDVEVGGKLSVGSLAVTGEASAVSFSAGTLIAGTLSAGAVALNGPLTANEGLTVPAGKAITTDGLAASQAAIGAPGSMFQTRLRVRGPSVAEEWCGRIVGGGDQAAVVLGELDGKAYLAAHTSALNAWADLHINGGSGNVVIGGPLVASEGLTVASGKALRTDALVGTRMPGAAGTIDACGGIGLQDANLYLRGSGDANHGLGWFAGAKKFAGRTVDGPALFGFDGGLLGTTHGGQRVALEWSSAGKVTVHGPITAGEGLTVPAGKAIDTDVLTANRATIGAPMSLFQAKFRVHGPSVHDEWAGRIVGGGDQVAVVLGEWNGKAYIGAHNAALNAWADVQISAGPGNVYVGGPLTAYEGLTLANGRALKTDALTGNRPPGAAGTLDACGGVGLNDTNLYLRTNGDTNHGLGWFAGDKAFAGRKVDGPALFGFDGGLLGTTREGQRVALEWDRAGKVTVKSLEIGGPDPSTSNGDATLYLHHHGVVGHQLRYRGGTLHLEQAGNGWATTASPNLAVGGVVRARNVRSEVLVHRRVIHGFAGSQPARFGRDWTLITYAYGPFAYAMGAPPEGATRRYRAYLVYTDDVTSGHNEIMFAFENDAAGHFTIIKPFNYTYGINAGPHRDDFTGWIDGPIDRHAHVYLRTRPADPEASVSGTLYLLEIHAWDCFA